MGPLTRRVQRVTAGGSRRNRSGSLALAGNIDSVSPLTLNRPVRLSASKYFVSCVAIGSAHIIRVEPIAPNTTESADIVTGAMKRLHEPLPVDLPGSGNSSVGCDSFRTAMPERFVSRHELFDRAGGCGCGLVSTVAAFEPVAASVAGLCCDAVQPAARAARQNPISQWSLA